MKIGDILTVQVDPETNGGLEEAAALVTGVYEDGSARVRVFGAEGTDDHVRNYVGEDGEPFDHDAAAAEPAPPANDGQPAPVE